MASYPVYGTVDDADDYWEAHGDPSGWSDATSIEKGTALRMASEYLDFTYGTRWVGLRAESTQERDWPRIGAIDSDGNEIDDDEVPQAIEDCTYYLALRYIENGDLMADRAPTDSTAASIAAERDKIGDLETEVEYLGGKPTRTLYDRVENMLRGRGLIGGSNRLLRA